MSKPLVLLLSLGAVVVLPALAAEPSAGTTSDAWRERFEPRFREVLEPDTGYEAVVTLAKGGTFTIRLRPDLAPNHVANFVELARKGFYDGTTFHRVLDGFMAQGGDPTGTGTGGPGYTVKAEFSDTPHVRGTVSMARSASPDSGGSQFFIVFERASHLDRQYTVFGEVTEGMDVVDSLRRRDPARDSRPGDAIEKVEIVSTAISDRAGAQP